MNVSQQPLSVNPEKPQEDQIIIDWIEFTLPLTFDKDSLSGYLGISDKWKQLPKGMHGYKYQWLVGGVRILSGGTAEMGHHVIISGSALRSIGSSILRVLEFAHYHGRLTRLDIAYDCVSGGFSMDTIKAAISGGSLVTPFRKWRLIQGGNLSDCGVLAGETIYFGSAQSRISFRIYDKGLETGTAQKDEWIRIEVQLRDEHAHSGAGSVLGSGAGPTMKGICSRYISFRTFPKNSPDTNKSRWPLASWFDALIEKADKLKLATDKIIKTLKEKRIWFGRQIAPTFAALIQAFGSDAMMDIYKEGARRISKETRAQIDAMQEATA